MSPAVGKALPFAMAALVCAAGFHVWKNRRPPADAATPPRSSVRQARDTARVAAPPGLAPVSDPGQAWQVRIAMMRNALRSECGEREIRCLYDLLAAGPPKGELPEHWYVIANEFMDQLLCHDADRERFSSSLLRILRDPGQPLVLRDYAVQHLAALLNPRSRQPSAGNADPTRPADAPSPETAARILDALVAAATDPALEQSTIPGTTLMMLVNLVRSPGDVDCSKAITGLKPWLARALQDGSSISNPVRVSAVQAAAVLAPLEFRPALRRLAYQENGQSSLRLPAIAAMAHCGESDDIGKLQQIARTRPELFYAAREAGTALSARLARPGN